MNTRLVFWSITSALAGFLFGFDTVVISGAEQKIQALWDLSAGMHGIAMGSALYGTVVGSLLGGWPTDRFGRRKTLLLIGVLYLSRRRVVGDGRRCPFLHRSARHRRAGHRHFDRRGAAVHLRDCATEAPRTAGRHVPVQHRLRHPGGLLSNCLLTGIGENAWRWMLGVAAIPSLIYTLLCFGLPESPRWLISRRNDRAGGRRVLQLIEPDASSAEIDAEAASHHAQAASDQVSSGHFWTWQLRLPILLAFLIAFFNQLSGINAILYFAPRIFEMTGLAARAAFLQSVGIGITNLIFTFVGLWLIDRLGRRTLLYIGCLSATSSRWAWCPGPSFTATTASCRSASSPSSPRTRSARAR